MHGGNTGSNPVTVIRSAAERQGYQVEGFAPTSRAARQLNEAGIESGTLQGFLARATNPDLREQRHFYLVDAAILDRALERGRFIHLGGPSGRTCHLNLEEVSPATADRSDFPELTAQIFRNPHQAA